MRNGEESGAMIEVVESGDGWAWRFICEAGRVLAYSLEVFRATSKPPPMQRPIAPRIGLMRQPWITEWGLAYEADLHGVLRH